MSRPRGGNPRP